MKQGSFRVLSRTLGLVLLAGMTALPLLADDKTTVHQLVVLDSFDAQDKSHTWPISAHIEDWKSSWRLDASKFSAEGFPQLRYIPSYPQARFGTKTEGDDGEALQSLGIRGSFDRQGYNWIDVIPQKDGEDYEIPLPGRVASLDMWVWGSNLDYYLEVYLRDYQGVVHRVFLGDLAYEGWKDLRAVIPANIPQGKRVLPRLAGLKFVKFRVWTKPGETVDNFYVYLDHLEVLTDTFETLFDGNDLADPDKANELWANQ